MSQFRPMLRDHGLTEQQWRVIRALSGREKLDASELAERCFLLAPSLTRILQHLEKENIVGRSADANDQRRSYIELTEKGRAIFDEVGPDSEKLYALIEEKFGVDRMNNLYELLAEFYMALNGSDIKP